MWSCHDLLMGQFGLVAAFVELQAGLDFLAKVCFVVVFETESLALKFFLHFVSVIVMPRQWRWNTPRIRRPAIAKADRVFLRI